ncbi:MAG: hypothetical protein PHZ23_15560 [Acidiphilium sp.]|nr:hypothetical protein [Acidiphilium sp.]
MRHFGTLFFVLIVAWLGWSLTASTPDGRMARACRPSLWVMRGIASFGTAANMDWAPTVNIAGENVDYRCRLTLWDYWYRDRYRKEHAESKAQADNE